MLDQALEVFLDKYEVETSEGAIQGK